MTQPTRIDGLPDLPKLPKGSEAGEYTSSFTVFNTDEVEAYATAHGLACYEAGSAAAAQAAKQVPAGFVLVPMHMTDEMEAVTRDDTWQWEDLLAAACAITEEQYDDIQAGRGVPSAPSLAEAAEAQVAPDLNALIGKVSAIENDFIARYEFDDGESAPHTPTEFESMLITDAIFGLHAEQEWAEAYHAWDVARRAGGYKPWSRVDSEVAPEAAEAGQVGAAGWSAGTEDADGNPLVTVRADELRALAEFAAGPGLSAWRIDGDMVRREVLATRMQAVAADALAATPASPQAPAPQAATGEDLAIYDSIARNYMRDGKPATHAEARVGFPKDGTK